MQVLAKVESESAGGASGALEIAERKVISTAFLSIEVDLVEAATTQVRDIADSLGGFLENLNSSGADEGQQANMTVRVPQAQFSDAVERIELVGKVQSKNLGSEDVSERFIDLQAHLKSSIREEESLLSLLGRTTTVSEVLTIERELTRVRSNIERFQAQLNFLERRIDLATITVSLFSPDKASGEPPSASMRIEVNGVTDHVDAVKSLVASPMGCAGLCSGVAAQRKKERGYDRSRVLRRLQLNRGIPRRPRQGAQQGCARRKTGRGWRGVPGRKAQGQDRPDVCRGQQLGQYRLDGGHCRAHRRVGPWSDSGDRILWCLPPRRQDFLTSAAPYPRIFCLHPVALRMLGPRRYCYLTLLLSGVLC